MSKRPQRTFVRLGGVRCLHTLPSFRGPVRLTLAPGPFDSGAFGCAGISRRWSGSSTRCAIHSGSVWTPRATKRGARRGCCRASCLHGPRAMLDATKPGFTAWPKAPWRNWASRDQSKVQWTFDPGERRSGARPSATRGRKTHSASFTSSKFAPGSASKVSGRSGPVAELGEPGRVEGPVDLRPRRAPQWRAAKRATRPEDAQRQLPRSKFAPGSASKVSGRSRPRGGIGRRTGLKIEDFQVYLLIFNDIDVLCLST